MENWLYFNNGTIDGTASTEQSVCYPASRMLYMEMESATTIRLIFEVAGEAAVESSQTDYAIVTLTVTSGAHITVMQALALLCQPGGSSKGFRVIADDENSVYAHSDITGVAALSAIDAT